MLGVGWLVVAEVNDRLVDDALADVDTMLHLEADRIDAALASQEAAAIRMATNADLVEALDTNAVDPSDMSMTGDTIDQVIIDADRTSFQALDIQVLVRSGRAVGQTDGFSWAGSAPVALEAMDGRQVLFGPAFVNPAGSERLTIVAPVVAPDGAVVGALAVESRLASVVDGVARIEAFGDTAEAVILQRTSATEATPITLRRFDRSGTFNAMVDLNSGTPSAQSLSAGDGQSVDATDYRGVRTIAAVQTIERTGWGLVVKIDRAEAFSLTNAIRRYVSIATAVVLLILLFGWLTQVRPLGRRIRETAAAAERVAGGDYQSLIGDRSTDEIGDFARGIDRLAKDLDDDIRARQRVEEQLRHQAHHDALTGLINRQHATTRIETHGDDLLSMLFLDLDGFKEINDTHGHGVGDEVLQALARRLEAGAPEGAILARWGGDEFLVLMPGVGSEEATAHAAALAEAFDLPVTTRMGEHTISASIGAAGSDQHSSAQEVLLAADAAMFRAKRRRNSYAKISPATIRTVESALRDDRVEAFFQPVVQLVGGEPSLISAEALVRIRNADGSMMYPDEFLPALGDSGLASNVDVRVMKRALETLGSWHRQGIVSEDFSMALNVGPAAMRDQSFPTRLGTAIVDSGVAPSRVVIEVPETVEVVESATLAAFRALGVRLAIDDVGVQYSNLERMVDLDADIAKLDRRWIPDLATAESSKFEVLKGLVQQCHLLGLDVVAEGVETLEQVEMLNGFGVTKFQGYFFGKPVSTHDFISTWCSAPRTTHRLVS